MALLKVLGSYFPLTRKVNPWPTVALTLQDSPRPSMGWPGTSDDLRMEHVSHLTQRRCSASASHDDCRVILHLTHLFLSCPASLSHTLRTTAIYQSRKCVRSYVNHVRLWVLLMTGLVGVIRTGPHEKRHVCNAVHDMSISLSRLLCYWEKLETINSNVSVTCGIVGKPG